MQQDTDLITAVCMSCRTYHCHHFSMFSPETVIMNINISKRCLHVVFTVHHCFARSSTPQWQNNVGLLFFHKPLPPPNTAHISSRDRFRQLCHCFRILLRTRIFVVVYQNESSRYCHDVRPSVWDGRAL